MQAKQLRPLPFPSIFCALLYKSGSFGVLRVFIEPTQPLPAASPLCRQATPFPAEGVPDRAQPVTSKDHAAICRDFLLAWRIMS